jgi:hypothetical protein
MSQTLARAILTTIKFSGFNVGQTTWLTGEKMGYMVDAYCNKTGERWAVMASSRYEATVELAAKLGFELKE